jgi:hypothetical protein
MDEQLPLGNVPQRFEAISIPIPPIFFIRRLSSISRELHPRLSPSNNADKTVIWEDNLSQCRPLLKMKNHAALVQDVLFRLRVTAKEILTMVQYSVS